MDHLVHAIRGTGGLEKYGYEEHKLTSPSSFRLMILGPGTGYDVLQAQFVPADLEHLSTRYEALSYTWGSPKRSNSLLINSQWRDGWKTSKLLVTANLRRALKALRHEHLSRTLWVDAVCINQDNTVEKNKQVAMMRHIYNKASRTIIYLGEDFRFCRKLVTHMPAAELFTTTQALLGQTNPLDLLGHGLISGICDAVFNLFKPSVFNPFSPQWYRKVLQMLAAIFNLVSSRQAYSVLHSWWQAWVKLFSHEWFLRCWVLQELVMSTNLQIQCGKTVLCGNDSEMNFAEFEAFARNMWTTGPGFAPRDRAKFVTYLSGIRSFVRACDLRYTRSQSAIGSLLILLTRFGSHDSTDDKDQLFAFLGLSREAEDPSLTPDYNEALSNTISRYAKYFISQEDGIKMLYDFRCGHTLPDMPSWAPNWAAALDTDNSRFPWLTYLERADGEPITHSTTYRASARSAASMHIADEATNQLAIKGVLVDDIFYVGSVYSPEKVGKNDLLKGNQRLLSFYVEMDQIATLRHIHVPAGQSLGEAKWRTLKGDCSVYLPHKLELHLRNHEREKAALRIKNTVELQKLLQHTVERVSENRMGSWQVYRSQSFDSKKLCLTNRGYLGQVPHSTQVGDKVCIFLGSTVPHVIRPVEGVCYRLLGTAYIHGIMQGEAIEGENIEIRELKLI